MKYNFVLFKKNRVNSILLTLLVFGFCVNISIAQGTRYYVDAVNGNDSWSGHLGAPNASQTDGPWRTTSKVNNYSFDAGDEVYFMCGDEWHNQTLTIDWDNFVLGAYYWDGVDEQTDITGHPKPIISGTNPTVVNTDYSTDGYPSNYYTALVSTTSSVSGVIQDISVKQSAGIGILTLGQASNVYRCDSYQTANYGIGSRDATSGRHSYNTVDQSARCYGLVGPVNTFASNRPADYSVSRSSGMVFDHNLIKNSFGEGFQTNNWAHDIIFEDNEQVDIRLGFNIWCASSVSETYNITIRRNLIWRTTDPTYNTAFSGMAGSFVYLNDVSRNPVHNIYIYNNLAVDRYSLVYFSGGSGLLGPSHDIYIYNNDLVRGGYGIYKMGTNANFVGTNLIRNNLFTGLLFSSYNGGVTANLDWSNNAFDTTPDAGSGGSGDIIGNISLEGDGLWGGDNVYASYFRQSSGSSTINAGVDLGDSPYNVDYWGTNRDTNTPWDIGAHEDGINTGVWLLPEQQEELNMGVYPNPSATGSVTVAYELREASDVSIYILDEMGNTKKILKYRKEGGGIYQEQVSTVNYPPGLYFCKLVTGGGLIVRKFIVA